MPLNFLTDLPSAPAPPSSGTALTLGAESVISETMERGRYRALRYVFPAGIDLRTWTDLAFVAKKNLADADGAAVLTKRKGSGAGTATTILVDPDAIPGTPFYNICEVRIMPADTASNAQLPAHPYPYPIPLACNLTGDVSATDVEPLASGWLVIEPVTVLS